MENKDIDRSKEKELEDIKRAYYNHIVSTIERIDKSVKRMERDFTNLKYESSINLHDLDVTYRDRYQSIVREWLSNINELERKINDLIKELKVRIDKLESTEKLDGLNVRISKIQDEVTAFREQINSTIGLLKNELNKQITPIKIKVALWGTIFCVAWSGIISFIIWLFRGYIINLISGGA